MAKVSILLLLLLFVSAAAAGSPTKLVAFELVNKCPTPAASLVPHKLSSKLQCAASCSRLPTCNAFHFDKLTRHCFHGDACSRLEQWTDGAHCESYKYTDVLCGDCEPVLAQLKLKLFYKFSRSGVNNEANPRQFCLTAHDVTIDGGGAHFKGHTGSYLSTQTPGFHNFLAFDKEYSVFISVKHAFDSAKPRWLYYYRFLRCGTHYAGNLFYKFNDKLMLLTSYLENNTVQGFNSESPSALPSNGLQHEISVGFSVNGTANQHYFVNGSFVAASLDPNAHSYSPKDFECLHLGQGNTDSKSLNGTKYCFGFSTKVLSLTEFQLAQRLCDNE